MAKQEHIELLRQGIDKWNSWRAEHQIGEIDLSFTNLIGAILIGADLSGAILSGADLRGAILSGADLSGANLSRTDLSGADLVGAILSRINLNGANLSRTNLSRTKLSGANLSGANLSGANLSRTNLSGAILSGTNLSRTNLSGAILSRADLSGANLSGAMTWETYFTNIDLRGVEGLETINHRGPSHISTSTLEKSEGAIPEVFLRGAGLSDIFIEYVHTLVSHPSHYYTCFISYSSKDQEFAQQLHADLQNQGIRCWYAPHSMRPGTVIRREIDQAIRLYDKLLLVLSLNSVESTWVEFEVVAALDKEKERHQEVLFPIRLDDTVLTTTQAWAADIGHQRHVGDFTAWKEHDTYRQVFDQLVRDLRTSTTNKKT